MEKFYLKLILIVAIAGIVVVSALQRFTGQLSPTILCVKIFTFQMTAQSKTRKLKQISFQRGYLHLPIKEKISNFIFLYCSSLLTVFFSKVYVNARKLRVARRGKIIKCCGKSSCSTTGLKTTSSKMKTDQAANSATNDTIRFPLNQNAGGQAEKTSAPTGGAAQETAQVLLLKFC
jgi:hypothetical protein